MRVSVTASAVNRGSASMAVDWSPMPSTKRAWAGCAQASPTRPASRQATVPERTGPARYLAGRISGLRCLRRRGHRRRRDQVLDEPVARRARGDLEARADVGVEVPARDEHELLRVRRRLVRRARKLAGHEAVE